MVKKVSCVFVLVALATAWAHSQDQRAARGSSVELPGCLVTLIDEAEVGPQEAGILKALEAYEGLEVEEGTILALIDDSLVQSEWEMADAERKVARAEAANNSEEKVASATLRVAEAELDQVLDANKRAPGAKSQAEVNVKRLGVYKSEQQVIYAQMNRHIAQIKAEAADQKVKAVEIGLERRKLRAPLSGKVVKVYRHKGEYATPSEPVLRMVRLDRLRVVGFVDYNQFTAGDLHARPVTLKVTLAGGRPATFEGKISFVDPQVVATKAKFEFHAEVVNRQENGEWLLQPGVQGELTVDLTHRVEQREAAKEPLQGPAITVTR